MKNILITGCAGFIGFSLSKKLLEYNYKITGIDNLNSYYDVKLKKNRLKILKKHKNFHFYKIDISKKTFISDFKNKKFDIAINLAAQAGIRYSLINPHKYIDSNIKGFLNLILLSANNGIKNIYYASSSSVYGDLPKKPFKENNKINKPLQFYAVTKITNELMAKMYSKLYSINFTGFRFFTVYGPYGRPDMSIFKFTDLISKSKVVTINGDGNHERDFTFIDDITSSIIKVIVKDNKATKPDRYRIFNIGNGQKIKINKIIEIIEKYLNKKANKRFVEPIEADMKITLASFRKLENYIGIKKRTQIETGIKKFVKWYTSYNK